MTAAQVFLGGRLAPPASFELDTDLARSRPERGAQADGWPGPAWRLSPRRRAAAQLASVGRTNRLARFGAFVLGTFWLLIVLAPIYYIVLTSLPSQGQYLSANESAW
jgi:hypothetical protein